MKKLILALALTAFALASQADDGKTIKVDKSASGCAASSCCQEKKSSCGEKSGCNKSASKTQSPKGAEQSK